MGWGIGCRHAVAALALCLTGVAVPVVAVVAASGPQAAAAGTSVVWGQAYGPHNATKRVSVSLFTSSWVFLRTVKSTSGGVYRISGVAPGRYWLQATDLRKPWDIKKFARTDAKVVVPAGRAGVQRDISMHSGAFVTGRVVAGKPLKRAAFATVRVVSEYGATFETTADKTGGFALGGLPGNQGYSVFFYDKSAHWTGKSVWVRKLKPGRGHNLVARLRTRAGGFIGVLTVNGLPAPGTIWGTVVNTKTGQFWVEPIKHGDLSRFRGLAPGRYRLQLNDNGLVYTQTIKLPLVRSGRVTRVHASARWRPAPKPKPTKKPTTKPTSTSTATGTATSTATGTSTATETTSTPATTTATTATTSAP